MPRTDNSHWFEGVARHLGPAYLRYSFTKGTRQESEALVAMLELEPGERVLDVGCGPGRHSLALARRGFEVVGVDISADFVALGSETASSEGLDNVSFITGDARHLRSIGELGGPFDAVISLCQGAFGLAGGPGAESDLPARELDEPILAGMSGALRPGGRLAVSAFSAYFMLRFLEEGDDFDADSGVNHEHTTIRDVEGVEVPSELWTTCFTPRELRLLARLVGLEPRQVYGVSPGRYTPSEPSLDLPEFLLLAAKA